MRILKSENFKPQAMTTNMHLVTMKVYYMQLHATLSHWNGCESCLNMAHIYGMALSGWQN